MNAKQINETLNIFFEEAPGVLNSFDDVLFDDYARNLPVKARQAAARLVREVESVQCDDCGTIVGKVLAGDADERIDFVPAVFTSSDAHLVCESCFGEDMSVVMAEAFAS